MLHSFIHLYALNALSSCAGRLCQTHSLAPPAQTSQTPHKLKQYRFSRADLLMHLKEGLGRTPTIIFSLTSRVTQSFDWV